MRDLHLKFAHLFSPAIYIDIPKGWFSLVENTLLKFEKIYLSLPEDQLFNYKISTLKNKFGTLRIYTEQSITPSMSSIFKDAEFLSGLTCEVCSEHAAQKALNGRVYTLCEKCSFLEVKRIQNIIYTL
jgi:hypothetical protein